MKARRAGLVVLAAALALAMAPSASGAPGGSTKPLAPPTTAKYLVTLSTGTDLAEAVRSSNAQGAPVTHVYGKAINGYAADMTEAQATALAKNPNVVRVEPDQVMNAIDTQANPPSWGLDRIDQRDLPLSLSYTYDAGPGSGVKAYIIDTGVLGSHTDFGGRVSAGYSVINGVAGVGNTDCNGHGTHVAGTVAGSTYGVAKAAGIVPIRILNCRGSGQTSDIVAGINWAINDHGSEAAVANMSLGGSASPTLDNAVDNLVKDGVSVAVAAGNSNADACTASPARTPSAITVGATDSADARASFSNFGTCLDIFAPGVGITSAWNSGGTNTISGTSMASPHVAGAAAVLLGKNRAWTPAQVADALAANSTANKVTNAGAGSPNRLLFSVSAGGSSPSPTPSPTPTVSPTPAPATAPAAPTSVKATAGAAKGSATLTWVQGSNGGSALTGQTVKVYRGTSSTAERTLTVSATATSLSLSSLASKVLYTFGVSATNAIGTSTETRSNAVTIK